MAKEIKNYLKSVKDITAPLNWKSSSDSPPTQLAYVTQPEIDMLVKANIHGSMNGKPNMGPKGIISLDGGGSYAAETKTDKKPKGASTGASQVQASQQQQQQFAQNVAAHQAQTGGSHQSAWEQNQASEAEKERLRKIREGKIKVEQTFGDNKEALGTFPTAEQIAAEKEQERLERAQDKKQGIISKYLHGEVLDDYVGDKNWVTPKGQHKLRSQLDRLTAKYGEDFLDTEQAKVLMNYLSGVAVERGGGLGARTEETDAELIGPTNVEDIPMYDPVTGEYRSPEERQALAEAAQYRLDALNKFAGIGGLDAAEGATSTAAYLKGLDPKQLRLGLSPDQYFQFRQQLMAADPTAGNQLYKDTFPWSSGSGVSKLATPMMSILKEAGQGLSGLIPQDAKTMGKDLFGNFGNIFGTKPEWADWRANQRIFEDTSTPVYGQNNQMDRREPSWWNTGGESQPVEDENENENENENDAVNLTPTPTPFPTYGTGIAGLDWASLAPQFGPQYPGHYSNQGIQPNFANWYDNLNKYYG